jgi:hypothetical protein
VATQTCIRPATFVQRACGALLVAASLIYLVHFVPRGWVPHDEGMRGEAAEQVLAGHVPHVDYAELYTGGLTWVHAAVFKIAGTDVVNLRWLLFIGVCLAQWMTYSMLRRFLGPVPAAGMAWLALTWSFPNFFASEASWWLLIFALACLLCLLRFFETGNITYAALAGLSAGLSLLIKQTGVYLAIAVMMALLYDGDRARPSQDPSESDVRRRSWRGWEIGRIAVSAIAVLLALWILKSRLFPSDLIYLFLPIAACSRVLVEQAVAGNQGERTPPRAVAAAAILIALPLACFSVPYVLRGQVGALVNGLMVLPQKRLVYTNMDLPSVMAILTGLPFITLFLPLRCFDRDHRTARVRRAVLTVAAAAILLASSLFTEAGYQVVWQSARAFSALLPIFLAWSLLEGHVRSTHQRRILFSCAVMLAWASLVQFPFSAPIYFCYVAPFAVLTAAAASRGATRSGRLIAVGWAATLLAFAIVSMNRGYIYNLGQKHSPDAFNVSLDLPVAHLRVTARDAAVFQRLVAVVAEHRAKGRLLAGPDAPEVYFLTRHADPSGEMFDVLADDAAHPRGIADPVLRRDADVIVINHYPAFSPAPALDFLWQVRNEFPAGESVGQFEVRWR